MLARVNDRYIVYYYVPITYYYYYYYTIQYNTMYYPGVSPGKITLRGRRADPINRFSIYALAFNYCHFPRCSPKRRDRRDKEKKFCNCIGGRMAAAVA